MKKRIRLFNLLIIITLFLSACNLPSSNTNDVAGTAAAQTVQALLNASPLPGAITPSSTPGLPVPATLTPVPPTVPTNTPILPTATTYCNAMQFVTDVTYPDGTVVAPGAAFTKTWRLKNVGTCAWTPSYTVVFSDGNSMSGPSTQALVGNVNPGQTIDIPVNLTAPASAGDYTGNWRIRDASGILFGRFYVQIKVQGPATITFTPTATNTSAPAFAVTSVTFTNTGTCGAFTATANITVNSAGSVTYHWIRSDSAPDGAHLPVVFAAAGAQSVNTTWSAPPALAPGTYWIDIYIDGPNHQQFGRASFTCP
jgi:hypothetical protein